MGHASFTEKPSKGSKSLLGLNKELYFSEQIHQKNVAILVSALVLRSRNLGQIDIVCINSKKEIEVFEVKGTLLEEQLKRSQFIRLKNSLNFLTAIFNLKGRIRVLN